MIQTTRAAAMIDEPPQVSIVVPHRDDLRSLDCCLAALEAQTLPRDRFEIVVADNGSRAGIDAVRAVAGSRGRVVEVTAPGAGPARNGGVAAARGEILAFTDCDCLPEPCWLEAGLRALEPEGIVGGQMTVLVENETALTGVEAFERVFAFDNEDYVRNKHFSVTANLFVRAADFARVGGFRTGVSEDMEWCLRARDHGLCIVYAADAIVGHPARRTWPELRRKWERIIAEQHMLVRERSGTAVWLLRTWAVPLSILAHLPRALASPKLSHRRDRIGAAAILVRLRAWRFIYAHSVMRRPH